ncbi:unnamed protein product [Calicophoron daubneyi]|uniref:Uncharacterized protein n=1 Tax=Calicophoron daubneyi TaxID=300641 RepID=A0AAV2TJF7_CALDB
MGQLKTHLQSHPLFLPTSSSPNYFHYFGYSRPFLRSCSHCRALSQKRDSACVISCLPISPPVERSHSSTIYFQPPGEWMKYHLVLDLCRKLLFKVFDSIFYIQFVLHFFSLHSTRLLRVFESNCQQFFSLAFIQV